MYGPGPALGKMKVGGGKLDQEKRKSSDCLEGPIHNVLLWGLSSFQPDSSSFSLLSQSIK